MVHLPLVTPEVWAAIACMGGYAFGVNTSCNDCDYSMNGCLRLHMEEGIQINELMTEERIGHDLSAKYHVQDFDWDGQSRIQINNAGIAELNVQQSIERVEEGVSISPYVLENVAVASKIVTVARAFADNPEHLMFRDATTHGSVETLYEGGYPQISGTDWLIKIDTTAPFVDVQHCKYMCVTIPSVECDGTLFAVHPGTEDIIPFAKDPVVDDTDTTYWFYAWSLVHPAFKFDDTIDLEAGQFWKLEQEIDFICSTSIAALPQVMCSRSGCDDDLVFAEDEDIILTQLNDNIIDVHHQNGSGCQCAYPMKLRVYYKTDPDLLHEDYGAVIKAIVWLTAAELPLKTCSCEAPDHGFIWTAQQNYATLKINPITGYSGWQLSYGDMHGQMVYAEQMSKVRKERRAVIV